MKIKRMSAVIVSMILIGTTALSDVAVFGAEADFSNTEVNMTGESIGQGDTVIGGDPAEIGTTEIGTTETDVTENIDDTDSTESDRAEDLNPSVEIETEADTGASSEASEDAAFDDECLVYEEDSEDINKAVPSYGLPVFEVTLAPGISLSTLNQPDKCYGYAGTTVTITDEAKPSNNAVFTEVEIKGRGNSTWVQPKKPYQIKFDKKVSLYGMPKSKKYVLLANYMDPSLIRNAVAFDLADAMGISPTTYQFVDLYINGEHLGNYMLCQKVEAGSNSLNLQNDYGVIAEIDFHTSTCVNHPEEDDIFLQERFRPTNFGGTTNAANLITLKDQVSKDEKVYMAAFDHIVDGISTLEKEAQEGNWSYISTAIDAESFAAYYLMSEYAGNIDAQRTSCYIYQDGYDDVLHAGPAWDYDISYGNNLFGGYPEEFNTSDYGWIYNDPKNKGSRIFSNLIKIDEFRDIVRDVWTEKMRPAIEAEYAKINVLKNQILNSANANNIKWSRADFDTSVKRLTSFMREKCAFMEALLGENAVFENGSYFIETAEGKKLTQNGLAYNNGTLSALMELTSVNGGASYLIRDHEGRVLTSYNMTTDTLPSSGVYFSEEVPSSEEDISLGQKWIITKLSDDSYVFVSMLNGMMLGSSDLTMSTYKGAQRFSVVSVIENVSDVAEDMAVIPAYLSGNNRYETTTAVSGTVYEGRSPKTIVLATGQNFPDALSANGFAGALGCPLLLTNNNQLSAATEALLKKWNSVKTVYIVGKGISRTVQDRLKALKVTNIIVIGGNNRYETAAALCEKALKEGLYDTESCFVATGLNPADSISVSTWCYQEHIPVLLTRANGVIDDVTAKTLKKFKKVYALGADSCVSTSALKKLGFTEGDNMTRLAGSNRYATSRAVVNEYLFQLGENEKVNVVLAKGITENYPDALAGGQLAAGKKPTVTLLVRPNDKSQLDYLSRIKMTNGIKKAYVLGAAAKDSTMIIQIQNMLR